MHLLLIAMPLLLAVLSMLPRGRKQSPRLSCIQLICRKCVAVQFEDGKKLLITATLSFGEDQL